MALLPDELMECFPLLNENNHERQSDPDEDYNCFAWAAGDNERRWDPGLRWYWPDGAPRTTQINHVVMAYGTRGYVVCASAEAEERFDKIALYTVGDRAMHAARQLPNGRWTSKLGYCEDVEHTLEALEESDYGQATVFLRRPTREGSDIG